MAASIPLLCFNDVYRVNQKYVPQPGAPRAPGQADRAGSGPGGEISVSQFAQLVYDIRDGWDKVEGSGGDEPEREGLVLFAGDVFNPSVESSVTRGSHMVPIMNALKVDCACVGNHDFDFGFPHLTTLIKSTNFPWLLSNIIDSNTDAVPEPLKRYWITQKRGVKIGVIGLVEEDWIATIPSWPEEFRYRPMAETAREISRELREEHGVEVIIALTHCRVPNDIKLAKELGAVKGGPNDQHGVDLLIGGHDHIYYIGKGATEWDGFPGDRTAKGTEGDTGVHLVKSGTDFRDLTEASLNLTPASNNLRKRTVGSLTGKHHYVVPSSTRSRSVDKLLKTLLSTVSATLQKPVCWSLTPFDARSEIVRTKETGLGNWVADVLVHAYAESLLEKGDGEKVPDAERRRDFGGVDAVIICGGTLRGDSQYGPGKITLGDILEILPFEDPVVCIEIDGKGIWDALEAALSKRFPIVSGLQVVWDHSLPPGQRVKSIRLVNHPSEEDDEVDSPEDMVDFVEQEDGTRVEVKQRKVDVGAEVKRDSSRLYRIITREYMAEGYDGFEAFKGRKFIIDDENGQIMSSIIRSFLLGSAYIFRHKQLVSAHQRHLSSKTSSVIARAAQEHRHSPEQSPSSSPKSFKLGLFSPTHENDAITTPTSPVNDQAGEPNTAHKRHVVKHDWSSIRAALWIAKHEHMSAVDECGGDDLRQQKSVRTGHQKHKEDVKEDGKQDEKKDELKIETNAQASYFVDQQSKEELKALDGNLAIVCPLVDGRMKDVAED